MRLRLTWIDRAGAMNDVIVSTAATTTVKEIACAFDRADGGVHRRPELTLRARATSDHPSVLLDPAARIACCGVRSGWMVEIAEESEAESSARTVPRWGTVTVMSGSQRGSVFSLIAGSNEIGRDRGSRIELRDPSVSRTHAIIDADVADGPDGNCSLTRLTLRDRNSANRIRIDGREVDGVEVSEPVAIELGTVRLRVTPLWGSRMSTPRSQPAREIFIPAPRMVESPIEYEWQLPDAPRPGEANRVPLLGLLAPALLGLALYAVTRSPMSLMMVAFSPIMMLGSWIDARLEGRRTLRRQVREFHERLVVDTEAVSVLQGRLREQLNRSAPSVDQIAQLIRERGSGLWGRHAADRDFLCVRLGSGEVPSGFRITGHPSPNLPQVLQSQADQFIAFARTLSDAPVSAKLAESGALGIRGDARRASAALRAIIIQIAALHSPEQVRLACFAAPEHVASWGWLMWLPHVSERRSGISAWPVASDPASGAALLDDLERIIVGAGAEEQSPTIVVLVLDIEAAQLPRLLSIAAAGPGSGVVTVWLAAGDSQVPSVCKVEMVVEPRRATAAFHSEGRIVPLESVEELSRDEAEARARSLAPLEDAAARATEAHDLPSTVSLSDLHDTEILGGAEAILQAWRASGSLTSHWVPGDARSAIELGAVIGQSERARLELNLRRDGPHALVAGTTGSGKSEFLQSWIMSLAATVSPDRITFLLVDYKGGSAFAECAELPHTVGLVTDLTPHLVHRVLTSLRAEIRRREELLLERGAKDLETLERRSDPGAPPALMVIVDEFAALAAEVPEFVEGMVDIAQRGRSLGVHLVLATQRPAGVITEQIRANTNLRIALRMASTEDSLDVIGSPEAARLPAGIPGRALMRVASAPTVAFQAAYVGGASGRSDDGVEVEIRRCALSLSAPLSGPSEPWRATALQPEPDLVRVRRAIADAARLGRVATPRRPWVDPLADAVELRVLWRSDPQAVALQDRPGEQCQVPWRTDPSRVGNLAIFGAGGTGKTSALISLAAAFSANARTDPVELYVIDAAGGVLHLLDPLPTLATVAELRDGEQVDRTLRHLAERLRERERHIAGRAAPGAAVTPRLVLMIDGFGEFREAYDGPPGSESVLSQLGQLMSRGRAVGIHVVLTADRASAIPAQLSSTLHERLVFRLANAYEYDALGVDPRALSGAPAGRCQRAGDEDPMQFAVISERAELEAQSTAIAVLARELHAGNVAAVPRIRRIPETLTLDELGPGVVGLELDSLDEVPLPEAGLGVIAGPPNSGRTTVLLTCLEIAKRRGGAGEHRPRFTLMTPTAGGALSSSAAWTEIVIGGASIARALERYRQHPERLGGDGSLLVIEDIGKLFHTDEFAEIATMTRAVQRAGVLVVCEYRQSSVPPDWELLSFLRTFDWGASLQAHRLDQHPPFGDEVRRSFRHDLAAGAGVLVDQRGARAIQFASVRRGVYRHAQQTCLSIRSNTHRV